MNEFFQNAEDQLFGNLTDREDIESAMEDRRLRDAVEQARLKESVLASLDDKQRADAVSEAIYELDSMVVHLLDSTGYVNGEISVVSPEKNEMVTKTVSNVLVHFQGFTARRDSDERIRFHYSLDIICHQDETPLTEGDLSSVDEDHVSMRLPGSAEFHKSSLDLHTVSSERAHAWLSLTHPEVLRDLEDSILAVRRDEDALLNLGCFRLSIPKENTERQAALYRHCVAEYVGGVVDVDAKVPYVAKLDGLALNEETGNYVFFEDEQVVFSIEGFNLFDTTQYEGADSENDKYAFALNGFIALPDMLEGSTPVNIPLSSIRSLESLRRRIYGDNQ